jgi:hypothetical protein
VRAEGRGEPPRLSLGFGTMKEGRLKSGGESKKRVTNPKQAIAIGLSKARKKGERVPAKKG